MRYPLRTLTLALTLLAAGCKDSAVTGNPSPVTEFRTLASMKPFITKSLTAAGAELQFGLPNTLTMSGMLVYIYNVEDQKRVALGFPLQGGTIVFARLQDRNGNEQNLDIPD